MFMDSQGGGEMNGRGENIVRTLSHVDVIVGMNIEFLLRCERGDDFVNVHIAAGSGPGLEYVNCKLVSVLARDNRFGRPLNRLLARPIEFFQLEIGFGTGFFD